MTFDPATLAAALDAFIANTGTVGHFALIDNTLRSTTVTINTGTDVLTSPSAHNMVTGTKVRLSAATTQPTASPALPSTVNAYLRSASSTTFTLHTTLAGAIANTGLINFSDTGSGTLTVNEQALDPNESPIAVIVNHEIVSAAYTARFPWTAPGAALVDTARKPTVSLSVNNTSASDIILGGLCFIRGGTSVIGNTTGTGRILNLFSTPITVPAFDVIPINFRLLAKAQTPAGALVP